MNRKGFTLIELLAVILVLAGVSLVAVAGISSSLENRDKSDCENQIELAKNEAKLYFSLNKGITEVTIKTLRDNKYFTENSHIDKLTDNDKVRYDNGYIFIGTGSCKE